MLNYNLNCFKSDVKYLRKYKDDISIDDEKIFMFLLKTKDMVETIINYGEFTVKEKQEQQKYLEQINKKLLKGENNELLRRINIII